MRRGRDPEAPSRLHQRPLASLLTPSRASDTLHTLGLLLGLQCLCYHLSRISIIALFLSPPLPYRFGDGGTRPVVRRDMYTSRGSRISETVLANHVLRIQAWGRAGGMYLRRTTRKPAPHGPSPGLVPPGRAPLVTPGRNPLETSASPHTAECPPSVPQSDVNIRWC